MTNNPCLRKNDSQLSWLREPETKFLGGGVWGKLGALGAWLDADLSRGQAHMLGANIIQDCIRTEKEDASRLNKTDRCGLHSCRRS